MGELAEYIDAFALDNDGPIIDSVDPEIQPAMLHAFEKTNVPSHRWPTREDLHALYDGDSKKYYHQFGSTASKEELDQHYLSKCDTNRAPLAPDIRGFLLTCEAYRKPVGIVSHHPGHEIDARQRREGLRQHFCYLWGGRRDQNGKPVEKVEKLREYSRQINVPLERILMIGDMIPDQVAAKAAGMPFALFLPDFHDRSIVFPYPPDFYLRSYQELAWLMGWSWLHEEYEWPPRLTLAGGLLSGDFYSHFRFPSALSIVLTVLVTIRK